MRKKMKEQTRDGRIHAEYIDEYKVRIEVDDKGCKFLIDIFSEFLVDSRNSNLELDVATCYSQGSMTKESMSLVFDHRRNTSERTD